MREYPFLSESIAHVLEKLRLERGMSKSALADFAAMQRKYLFEIEQGEKRPTVNAIFSLCEALQVEPDEFFRQVVARMKALQKESPRQ
ncbi:MAG: helix-turn-helix transcriptional regulator [Mailhella sp.]|nr:helix-turn-helix transcriptional regulator [Mailhella sp.]